MGIHRVIERYRIGKVEIELHMPEQMKKPKNIMAFAMKKECRNPVVYHIDFTDDIVDRINKLYQRRDSKQMISRPDLRIFYVDGKECRVLNFKGSRWPYAICLEVENGCEVWVNEAVGDLLCHDTIFYSLLCLERYMIRVDSLVFHSAYLCHDGKAILFSAPSETGKSTQASLWERYRGGRTINGDRSLIYKKEDGNWYACGWPICGDSGICNNEDYPIKALVMLKQSVENRVYPLPAMNAFQEVFAQMTVNGWNKVSQMQSMDLVEELIQDVPVYRQECDISEEAVNSLFDVLSQ